jgi:hypothetical protein
MTSDTNCRCAEHVRFAGCPTCKDENGEKQRCQVSLPTAVKKWGADHAEKLGVQVLQKVGLEILSDTLKYEDCLKRRDALMQDVLGFS